MLQLKVAAPKTNVHNANGYDLFVNSKPSIAKVWILSSPSSIPHAKHINTENMLYVKSLIAF